MEETIILMGIFAGSMALGLIAASLIGLIVTRKIIKQFEKEFD